MYAGAGLIFISVGISKNIWRALKLDSVFYSCSFKKPPENHSTA
jgi:hypothetical protein